MLGFGVMLGVAFGVLVGGRIGPSLSSSEPELEVVLDIYLLSQAVLESQSTIRNTAEHLWPGFG
jgi:hypothetical protein